MRLGSVYGFRGSPHQVVWLIESTHDRFNSVMQMGWMVKVCIVTSQYGDIWSGLGTYATNLINALANDGHDISVLCPNVNKNKSHPNVKLIDTSSIKITPTMGNWMFLSYLFNKLLKSTLQKESFDIIHYTDARESLFCSIKNTPIIGTMNDYYFMEAPRNPFYYKRFYTDWIKRCLFYNVSHVIEKIAAKNLALIIANTHYVNNSIASQYGVSPSNIRTIYYGLDTFDGTSTEPPLTGKPSILFVGANFQRKGLPTLIKAVAEAKKRHPEIMLHVVGNDAKQAAMEKLAKDNGITDNIHFFGGVDNADVQKLYARAQIFAMPSMIEGFGIVFLEAMSVGTAVIGGNCGGTPELITDTENGFVVNPDDWQVLAERIELLTRDKDLRQQFHRKGIQSFANYSVEQMLEKTLSVYAEQLNQS